MKTATSIAFILTMIGTPAIARNAVDYWCGNPRVHVMMWYAKIQDKHGYTGHGYMQVGIINHKLSPDNPKWVTVVPEKWLHDSESGVVFQGKKCTEFTEEDQDKYGVGYYGPREDLRYPTRKHS